MQKDIDSVDVIGLFWRRKWLIALFCVCSLVGAYMVSHYVMKSTYQATAKVLMRQESLDPANTMPSYVQDWIYFANQKQLITSRSMIERAVEKVGLGSDDVDQFNAAVEGIQNGLTVEMVRDTSVLSVSLLHGNKEIVAPLVNTLSDVFVADYTANKMKTVENSLLAVDREIISVREQQQRAEAALESYLREEKIGLLPEAEVAMYFGKYDNYDLVVVNAVSELERVKMNLTTLEETLRRGKPEEVSMYFLISSPVLSAIRTKMRESEAKLEQVLSMYSDNYPDAIALHKELGMLKQDFAKERDKLITAELEARRTDIRLWESKVAVLEQERREQMKKLEQVLSSQPAISQLLSEVKMRRNLLDDLLKKQRDLRIFKDRIIAAPDMFILEKARFPGAPISPNIPKNMMLAGLIGLTLGCAFALGMPASASTKQQPAAETEKRRTESEKVPAEPEKRRDEPERRSGERRSATRNEVSYDVSYAKVGGARTCRTCDISASGMRIVTEEAMNKGTVLDFQINRPDTRPVSGKGYVVWSLPAQVNGKQGFYVAGLKFGEQSPNDIIF